MNTNKNPTKPDPADKSEHKPFKLRQAMISLDQYLRIFIIPQVPAEYKEYRDALRQVMDRARHAMLHAALTEKRERQKKLLELKIEMMMVNVYLEEIRKVCYRGKLKANFTKATARRFKVCADKQRAVMEIVWGWVENEAKKLDPEKSQATAGLVEKEAV